MLHQICMYCCRESLVWFGCTQHNRNRNHFNENYLSMIGYFISCSSFPLANINPLWSGNALFLCISSLHHIYLVGIFMQRFNSLLDMVHLNQWWPSHVTSPGQKELNLKMYFEPSVVMMSKGGWGGMALTSEDKNNHLLQMTMASNMLQDSIKSNTRFIMVYADGLAQYCSNSIANTLELLQSCVLSHWYAPSP